MPTAVATGLDLEPPERQNSGMNTSERCDFPASPHVCDAGDIAVQYCFTYAPTPTWVLNFSKIKHLLDMARTDGVTDFRGYFETDPEKVRHYADALRIVATNKASLQLFHAKSTEEITAGLSAIFMLEAWVVFREALIALAQGETTFESDLSLRDLSGRRLIIHLKLIVIPEFAESLFRVLVSFTDITGHTQLTTALKASEERFRTLLSDIPSVSVQGYNAAGNVIFWNAASTHLYGYTNAEAMGRNLVDLIIPPPMRTAVQGAIAQMVKTLIPIPAGPLELRRKDGSTVPVFSSHAVLDIPDRGFELYCLDIDLSDLKRTEAELIEQKNVAQVLQEHLQQAAKMDAIGRLAGGVAHDFNNLLQAILGFTEILLKQTSLDDARHADLLGIQKAGTQAAGLTRQLLAFSRKQMIEPRVLDINVNVVSAKKMLHRLLGENIHLQTLTDPDLLPIRADPGQIDQVLLNLAVNARDAMFDGGQLTIRTSNVTLDEKDVASLPEARPGTFVCLSISDTGSGMNAETLSHLFEPFFTTKALGKGTGLGLAVIYGILKQNNGWINVCSLEGQGSTFNMYFPACEGVLVPKEKMMMSTVPSPAPPRGRGECIMVIEDNPAILKLVVTSLQSHGYRVLEGASTEEALPLFNDNKNGISLLFSDVVLPGENGIDLAEHLLAVKPDLPVLLTSGYADERARWGVIEARGFSFLQKPYPLATLLLTVRKLLDGAAPTGQTKG